MRRFVNFIIRLVREFIKNDLFALAGDMTYKLILSLFPLLMFAFSIIGFLNLDAGPILESIHDVMPPQAMDIILNFIDEVIDFRSGTVLSASLVVFIYNASSGFASIIKGINKSYGHRDTRGWLRRRLLSIILVLAFVVIVLLALGIMIFSGNIQDLIYKYVDKTPLVSFLFGLSGYFISIFIILAIIVMIYKIGNSRKVKILDVIPGACVTVIFWILFSKLYNIYVANYARYTVVYGSIGSIFIMLIWLNFIAAFLLVGAEVNALLFEGYRENAVKKVL